MSNLRSVGVIRELDPLGRVVIPRDIVKKFKLQPKTKDLRGSMLEIFEDGNSIAIRKYKPGCHCCTSMEVITEVLGIKLCKECLEQFESAREKINKLR